MRGNHYHHLIFGDHALARQRDTGSYAAYGAATERPDDGPDAVGDREIAMFTAAFAFHMATVSPAGWPYIQYRTGPAGFVHHLGGNRFGFADHHGNDQFATIGNIESDAAAHPEITGGRVALFLADHPRRIRVKMFGRATVIDAAADPALLDRLGILPHGGRIAARTERSIVIDVEAVDWNCSRSMIPLYDADYVRALNVAHAEQSADLQATIDRLTTELETLRSPRATP
ncbi:pyridoxamine 5'-phosphate oxidase family protein [Williamsia sp. CHRR-6]|uniref:pyridoxamine 5'-phosphate oxidase family protein n=1 Tax=Williamsia sp. CHRR-6 TaxID=2835871 RepID=UPI001BDA1ACB|nr:pyridoxamine 5'-phosphate oxidase family protein [Williamsia sp. CHRR-6]MBT0567156.1 pyridoxamine 5'-phosphate oxidase family protein [Williamsia sp. CHRR-6]